MLLRAISTLKWELWGYASYCIALFLYPLHRFEDSVEYACGFDLYAKLTCALLEELEVRLWVVLQ